MTDKIYFAEQTFLWILNMSLTGSFAITAVLAARVFLRKAPRIFSYCLWAAVLFRLLCPVSFSAVFSPLSALPVSPTEHGRMEYISDDILAFEDFTTWEADGAGKTHSPQQTALSVVLPTAVSLQTAKRVCSVIWILGVCAMTLYGLFSQLNLRQKVKNASWERENIYLTEKKSTPFVMGMVRPKIYLPVNLKENEKEYILLHEQIHLKRRDHIIKIISFLTLCLHWFNPLVWIAFFLSGTDMEMSCDEAVIRRLGNGVKKQYSSSLLIMSTGKRIINGVPLAFGEGNTDSRIKNVLRYKKPAALGLALAAVFCAIAAVVLLANPSVAEGEQVNPSEHVYIPGCGEVQLPTTVSIQTYFEDDENHVVQVYRSVLVEIFFSKEKESIVDEIMPAVLSLSAENITAVCGGFTLSHIDDDSCRLTFPYGAMPELAEAKAGDRLSVFWEESESQTYQSENASLLVTAPILEVGTSESGKKVLTIELSLSELQDVLADFGPHLRFSL